MPGLAGAGDPEGLSPDAPPLPDIDPAIFGAGQGIHTGSQVVVAGQGMGTALAGCPANLPDHATGHICVLIEGDRIPSCYPLALVTLYADIYAGTASYPDV